MISMLPFNFIVFTSYTFVRMHYNIFKRMCK
nr:MAG TPA: hypothetical protein [Caudoviricetes sp.]